MTTTKDAPDLNLRFVEIVSPRLWMSTSYKNTYIGNTRPAAALDIDAPLSGWYDCGTLMAARVPVTKDVFEFKQGIPKTMRKMWEVDRTAQVTFNTANLNPYVEAFILGQTLYNTVNNTASGKTASLAGARGSCTLASYCASKGFAADQLVVCASPTNASSETSYNMAMIQSVSGKAMTLEDLGFPVKPLKADKIKRLSAVDFMDKMGVDTVRSAMLFWDTYIDSSGSKKLQHAIYFPKLRNFSGGDIDFKDSSEPYENSVTMTAQAISMTFADATTGYDFYKKWVLAY